jgi:hypothetical protein
MYDYTYRLKMVNRIYCSASVFTLLSIGFIISGILLITFSDSIIKKAVNKVENDILFLEIFFLLLILIRNVN